MSVMSSVEPTVGCQQTLFEGVTMWVEPELLSSGGEVARSAGQRVLGGAAALSQAPIGSSIFGDFDAAGHSISDSAGTASSRSTRCETTIRR